MPKYRSATTTHGRNMAGARALWRATGMTDADFGKPIIAVVNSFTQFVPGHVHLRDLGKLVAEQIEAAGGVAKEFNTIAVDDGIAMGHGGMLYSLPSRELIADSVEYMVNAHCADAMVCISNCDKITPGMLMASLRLNIPVIFVSGGPMEAGKTKLSDKIIKLDLVDAMIQGADPKVSDEQSNQVERSACPTCGSCSGMFTANSMNCLTEALGLSQPGNGSLLATHADRKELFLNAGKRIVELTKRYYEQDDASALPRNIASKAAFENAMTLDIAMGGSTNTVLHLLAAAQEAEIDFTMSDIDKLSRKVPQLCKVAPSTQKYHMEDVHRAGGVLGILGELDRAGLLNREVKNVLGLTLPHTPAPAKGMPVQFRDLLCADAFALLKTRHFLIFSLCATLISVPLGTYYAYTASYLADAGVKDVSTAMSFGQMSEIVFMLVIPLLFRRLGVKYMLLIGMAAWFVRYAFFALGVSEEGRFLLYLGILLHGVCYDFFFVVGFIYTDRVAGEKVKGQAQSMIVMFTYGIGMLLGSQISGALYNHLVAGQSVPQAWVTFWWIPAVAAAVIALIFLFSFQYNEKEPH